MTEPPDIIGASADGGPPAFRRLTHIQALDGIRGLGLVLVVSTHALLIFFSKSRNPIPGGFIGLDAFFVLSGFLITSLLLGEHHKQGRISLRGFYRRRALRLLPALLCLLAAHAIYAAITNLPMRTELTSGAAVLFYVANWYRIGGHPVALGMGHLWSLAVEEQFYLVWPLVTLALLNIRRSPRAVYVVLCCAAAGVCVWRFVLWRHGVTPFAIQQRTDARADSLIIGALAGYVYVRRSLARVRFSLLAWPALALLAYCVFFLSARHAFWYVGGFTLVAIASAMIVLAIAEGNWAGIGLFNFAPFRVLGTVSYGVYLWHLPVFLAVARETPGTSHWAQLALGLAITADVTVLSWFCIERPVQLMKRGTRRDHDETKIDVPTAS